MRQVSVIAVSVLFLALSSSPLAGSSTPTIDFDRGIDASELLREARERAKKGTALPTQTPPVQRQGSCDETLRQDALRRLEAISGGIGSRAVIRGTPGDDIQNGTPEADVIYGFGGADQQFGKGGDDLILPGPGPGLGRIEGGEGNDAVILHDTGWVRFRDLYLNEAQRTSIIIIETETVLDSKGNCVGPS